MTIRSERFEADRGRCQYASVPHGRKFRQCGRRARGSSLFCWDHRDGDGAFVEPTDEELLLDALSRGDLSPEVAADVLGMTDQKTETEEIMPVEDHRKALLEKLEKQAPGVMLGRRYRDVVLGFEGVAYSVTTFITGCDRVNLVHLDDKGAETIEHYCDVTVLEPLGEKTEEDRPAVQERVEKDPGGSGEGVPKPSVAPR